jgi:hypothetical protein
VGPASDEVEGHVRCQPSNSRIRSDSQPLWKLIYHQNTLFLSREENFND